MIAAFISDQGEANGKCDVLFSCLNCGREVLQLFCCSLWITITMSVSLQKMSFHTVHHYVNNWRNTNDSSLGKVINLLLNAVTLHLPSLSNDFVTFSAIFCLEMDVPNRTGQTAVDRYDIFFSVCIFSPVQVLNAFLLEFCFFGLVVNVLFNLIFFWYAVMSLHKMKNVMWMFLQDCHGGVRNGWHRHRHLYIVGVVLKYGRKKNSRNKWIESDLLSNWMIWKYW